MNLTIQLAGDDNAIVNLDNSTSAAVITIPQETETRIYRERALTYPRLWGNQLGLYNFVDMEGRSSISMDAFKTPEYNLRGANMACKWDPDRGMDKRSDKLSVDPVQYQGEMCNAEIWGKCWRAILGAGNGINDIESTPAAVRLLANAIDSVHKGIGNDTYLLLDFGDHPLLELADSNEWWRLNKNMDSKKWARLRRQQSTLGGHITIYEGMKTEGVDQFNVEINPDDLVNNKYEGDTFELFDSMIAAQSDVMDAFDGDKIISVSSSIFNRHKKLVKDRYGAIESVYKLHKWGTDGEPVPFQVNPKFIMEYDGYYIYNRPEWNWLAKVTGAEVCMAVMNAAGSLAVGYDVSLSNQTMGMGMDVTYHKTGRFAGITEFNANFDLGASLLGGEDFCVFASLIRQPS